MLVVVRIYTQPVRLSSEGRCEDIGHNICSCTLWERKNVRDVELSNSHPSSHTLRMMRPNESTATQKSEIDW